MRLILAAILASAPIWAQTGAPVRISDDPPVAAVQQTPVISGSNVVAICYALSSVSSRSNIIVSISAATNANPVVFTSTAHGFDTNSRPQITISGGTGNWTAANGTWTATIIDANTFSIPVDSTALGAVSGTLTFTTLAPRKGVAEWAVKKFAYDATNNVVWVGWLGGTSGYTQKCSDATSTTIMQQ